MLQIALKFYSPYQKRLLKGRFGKRFAAGLISPVGLLTVLLTTVLITCFGGCSGKTAATDEKVAYVPMSTAGPNSLDPVGGSSVYANRGCSFVYQTLLQYDYFHRPLKLKPLLLAEMPKISEDGKTFSFKLRDDVFFHDNKCFADGKGRKIKSEDFFYSLKRMADAANEPKSWWLMAETIVGFDEFKKEQNEAANAGGKFDYDAPVEGMKVISDTEFQVVLKEPLYRFSYVLAMFQTSVVSREAVEHYKSKFSKNPVGTGPFLLKDWVLGSHMNYVRNPNYFEEYYPEDPGLNEDGSEPYFGYKRDAELGFYKDAGKRLPILDRVEIRMYTEAQPMWLKFKNRELDYTTVPKASYDTVFIQRTKKPRKEISESGVTYHSLPLLDLIYNGFNMEDPDYGGYTEEKKKIRQAICLCNDFDEKNRTFYNNDNVIYDGPIPPTLDGHPENHLQEHSYMGPDIARARQLLEEAGHAEGDGLPPLVFYTSKSGESAELAEMLERHLNKIGIKLDTKLVDFSTLSDKMSKKEAPFFGLAWGSDYPDAENNLALFYGPNSSPGSNGFNYKRPEYDKMYEQIRVMKPSPERTAIYEKMRDMVIEDCPMVGSMGRVRKYLVNPRLKNFKPVEAFYNYSKYFNVED